MTEIEVLNEDERAAIEDEQLTQQINETLNGAEKEAEKRAQKYIRKHKREIKRLEKRAQECLILGHKDGYKYAVGKLRSIIKKEVTEDVLESLWLTSREQYEQFRNKYFHEQLQAHVESKE